MGTPTNYKVCPNCKAAVMLSALECPACHCLLSQAASGYPYDGAPAVDSNRWVIAMLLAFFLGHWGVHRFYMGYNNVGILMLSLTLVGIVTFCLGIGIVILIGVGIWAFVDFILICCNNVPMADGTPLK